MPDALASNGPPTRIEIAAPVQVGRGTTADLRLLHPTVSRLHARVEPAPDGQLRVRDCDSRYGTFVNGLRIGEQRLCEGDLVTFGTSDAFRVVAGGALVREDRTGGTALDLRNIRVEKRRHDGTGTRVIVAGVSLRIRPNAFVGILGPSGSGKSTILSVLASYHQPAGGEVMFDDAQPVRGNLVAYRRDLGNVPQQDIVYDGLTVKENLLYAARIRFPPDTPRSDLVRHVERALNQAGLPAAGSEGGRTDVHGQLFQKLSGGQKKRVSVALELLERPRLLLLDEPTSGLDPAAEAALMEQFRKIASQGTTVVCTTHHMDNVHLFDTLVVLGVKDNVGRVAYVGPPDGFLPQIGCRSYADAFERLRDGAFEASPGTEDRPVFGLSAAADPAADPPVNAGDDPMPGQLPVRTLLHLVTTVAERQFRRIARDRGLSLAMIAQPVALGGIVAATQFSAINSRLLHFFLCVVAIWLGLNNSARDLVRERRNFVREQLSGLSPEAYLGAKLVTFAIIGLAQVVTLVTATLAVGKFALSSPAWKDVVAWQHATESLLVLVCVLFTAYLCGLGLGLLASTVADSEEAAVAALPLLIMPQILFSAVATGCVEDPFNKNRPFKPVVVAFSDGLPEKTRIGRLIDGASLLVYSRPASLGLLSDEIAGYKRYRDWLWLGDFVHLLLLLAATWGGLYVLFRRRQHLWPALIGLG